MKFSLLCSFLLLTSHVVKPQGLPVADVFLAKPYLQVGSVPTPTTLQLQWTTKDEDAKWTVEQKHDTKGSWTKSSSISSRKIIVTATDVRKIFSSTLTGLLPGTTFFYRVLRNGKEVFSSTAQAPRAPDQPFRFVAIGDIGAGTPEQRPLAHRAFLEKPDLVIVPGDIVYDRGLISEYDTRFWPVYNADKSDESGAPLMRSIPFVAAPGNHDTDTRNLDVYPDALAYFMYWNQPLNGPVGEEGSSLVPKLTASTERRTAFVAAAREAYPRMANFSFDYGNAHWIIIDSNPYVDLTDSTLATWLAADLVAARNATWRFVVFHHPGFNSAREHYEQQQMRILSPVLEAGHVDVVFNGHVHNYQRSFPLRFVPDNKGTLLVGGRDGKTPRGRIINGKWTLDKSFDGKKDTTPEGIIYLVTGAGGQDLYNPEQQGDPDSWQKFTDKFISTIHSLTVVDVKGNTLTFRQISADGKELDSFTVSK